MIELVVSGGQTGADQAGWRAAKAAGIKTGGWMPKGFKTEDGPRPEFARLYGAKEHESPEYPPRTLANARMADATIWFGRGDSRGFGCTERSCRKASRPIWTVLDPSEREPSKIVTLISAMDYRSINIAGNRESSSFGIGAWVEAYLIEVFRLLKEQP